MVQYDEGLDGVLAALSDPTRRAILQRLGAGEATISELAAPLRMSLTGAKKHVSVLERAGLVRTEKVGRTRVCRLGPRRLDDASTWIAAYGRMLEERMDRLGELLAETPAARPGSPGRAGAAGGPHDSGTDNNER